MIFLDLRYNVPYIRAIHACEIDSRTSLLFRYVVVTRNPGSKLNNSCSVGHLRDRGYGRLAKREAYSIPSIPSQSSYGWH